MKKICKIWGKSHQKQSTNDNELMEIDKLLFSTDFFFISYCFQHSSHFLGLSETFLSLNCTFEIHQGCAECASRFRSSFVQKGWLPFMVPLFKFIVVASYATRVLIGEPRTNLMLDVHISWVMVMCAQMNAWETFYLEQFIQYSIV